MGNFTKAPKRLGMVLAILVVTFGLSNIIPVNSVNAGKNCRADAISPISSGGGGCSSGDGTCISNYCFLQMQGFFDNKSIRENVEEQNEAIKGDINNPDPDCLATGSSSSMNFAMRGMCDSSSSSSSYYP